MIDSGGVRGRECVRGGQGWGARIELALGNGHDGEARRPLTDRLPWECVETLPHSDVDMLAGWDAAVAAANDHAARAHALVGRALASYWAVQPQVIRDDWDTWHEHRVADVA